MAGFSIAYQVVISSVRVSRGIVVRSMAVLNQFKDFLSAIAQLMWPLIAVAVLLVLLPELKVILRRIGESKNLKIRWGDKEISIQEAADNIQKVVGSVIEPESTKMSGTATAPGVNARNAPGPRSILWVDDRPSSNALEMATLKKRGIQITEAESTKEALEKFEPGLYGVIITDMSRQEDGSRNSDAGIDLAEAIRKIDRDVPIIAYCSGFDVKTFAQKFREAGGRRITSSAVELFKELDKILGVGSIESF